MDERENCVTASVFCVKKAVQFRIAAGLPHFSWYNIPKYTKLPQNIPNYHKIYQNVHKVYQIAAK
jgi:hypothetical protein